VNLTDRLRKVKEELTMHEEREPECHEHYKFDQLAVLFNPILKCVEALEKIAHPGNVLGGHVANEIRKVAEVTLADLEAVVKAMERK
jgi:hypothetical protein